LIKKADDLLNYSKGEEELAENIVKKIFDAGVTLVVSGGSISELIMHYLEKYKIMAIFYKLNIDTIFIFYHSYYNILTNCNLSL